MVIFSRSTKRTRTPTHNYFWHCPQTERVLSNCLQQDQERILVGAAQQCSTSFPFPRRKTTEVCQSSLDNSHKWATFPLPPSSLLTRPLRGVGRRHRHWSHLRLTSFRMPSSSSSSGGKLGQSRGMGNHSKSLLGYPSCCLLCAQERVLCSVFRVDLCANNPAAFSRKCQTHSMDKLSCFFGQFAAARVGKIKFTKANRKQEMESGQKC